MKTRDELLELIKDSMRLDWLQDHMECRTTDGVTDEWIWKGAPLTNRDLREAIDAVMMPKKTTPQAAGQCREGFNL